MLAALQILVLASLGKSTSLGLVNRGEQRSRAQKMIEGGKALNLAPLPLTPGERYVWQLTIDDQSHADWQVAFTIRPPQVV